MHYKTQRQVRTDNGYGKLSFGVGLGMLGISWLGHWSTIIVSTTILRGESGEVVTLTNYDLAFYADRYSAFLALILLLSALLSFLLSSKRSRQPPVPSLPPLAM